jgi:hypothetical protein
MARKRVMIVRDLRDDCKRCGALPGEKCKNYKGRGKPPCRWPAGELPKPQPGLFDGPKEAQP